MSQTTSTGRQTWRRIIIICLISLRSVAPRSINCAHLLISPTFSLPPTVYRSLSPSSSFSINSFPCELNNSFTTFPSVVSWDFFLLLPVSHCFIVSPLHSFVHSPWNCRVITQSAAATFLQIASSTTKRRRRWKLFYNLLLDHFQMGHFSIHFPIRFGPWVMTRFLFPATTPPPPSNHLSLWNVTHKYSPN